MTDAAGNTTSEKKFQNEIIAAMLENGWLLGESSKYNRELAVYPEDLLAFIKETQDVEWQKYRKLYPNGPEEKLLERVARQLSKLLFQ